LLVVAVAALAILVVVVLVVQELEHHCQLPLGQPTQLLWVVAAQQTPTEVILYLAQ
jgi:hypothetical protein